MIRGLFTAATGMQAQQLSVDVIANNLSNVNTTGFKRSRAEFQDLIYDTIVEPGAATSAGTKSPSGIEVGLGTRPAAVQKIHEQGDLIATSNQLDLAVEGEGFFQVTMPDGTVAYTRAGAFQMNETGQIVTADGFVVDPAVPIPSDALSITIGQDGTVTVRTPGSTNATNAGQFQLARFPNPTGLKPIGRNLYQESDASGTATVGTPSEQGYGRISQGFLESSNVNVVTEMVGLVTAQRAYDASQKAFQTGDELLGQAINIKR